MSFDPSARRNGWVLLLLLLLVNVFNFVDRQLPYILVTAIRSELKLTDAQFGLMAGLPFALVFSCCALLLARLADRYGARLVLVGSLAVWSLATALSGLAQGFFHLIAARAFVAAGESGSMPAAHALIARLFAVQGRALAYAVFSLAVPIGGTLGLVLGGWINDTLGWRQAFFVIGLPGVLLALLAWVALPATPAVRPPDRSASSFAAALRQLFRLRSYAHTTAACVLFGIAYFAMTVFGPAFLMRVHGHTATQAGLALGMASGIGGVIGILGGGILADHLGRKDARWRQLVPAIGVALCAPAALGAWLCEPVGLALLLLTLVHLLGLLCHAPTWANIQLLAPDDMRATATAVVQFCIVLVGASVGPAAIGWTSDLLAPKFGAAALRYALCGVAVFIAWSALHFLLASRAMGADLARVEPAGAGSGKP
ncbi:MAG TPA: MFS transporter [Ideonella sp.]|uniref:MFS transporter n=1 Tax=Ideonella sp. TaxID=1929293 RepID=UPI002BFAC632|nr:MFS transporter [Ideonella sp.]HSI49429.1 MFS transporter [Ideonella sp.]